MSRAKIQRFGCLVKLGAELGSKGHNGREKVRSRVSTSGGTLVACCETNPIQNSSAVLTRYLTSILSPHRSSCSLRSSRSVLKLHLPCLKTRLWGDRAFSVAAPHLLNNLPFVNRAAPSVNSFKSLLKHTYFHSS